MAATISAHLQLLDESRRYCWPEHWAADLDLDREYLNTYAPESFVWVLRDCGTHILPVVADQKDRRDVVWLKAIHHVYANTQPHYYVYADGQLRETTYDGALAWLESRGDGTAPVAHYGLWQ